MPLKSKFVETKERDMRGLLIGLFLLIAAGATAQNVTDANGKKQGFWTKRDREGRLVYQGTFKDDKPVGEMKRYHPNGAVMAVLNYLEASEVADARLFDERGKLIARGRYEGQKKVGEWTYLADSKIVMTETYVNGMKEGTARRYYKTGELLEESVWKSDQLEGLSRTFFQDGKVYLECNYAAGQLNGSFKSSFANGNPELEAFYTAGLRDKDWSYYDASGKLLYVLKFDRGKLLNPEVQDSVENARSKEFQPEKNNIPDPEKFMQNPEEYMRLMQNLN